MPRLLFRPLLPLSLFRVFFPSSSAKLESFDTFSSLLLLLLLSFFLSLLPLPLFSAMPVPPRFGMR